MAAHEKYIQLAVHRAREHKEVSYAHCALVFDGGGIVSEGLNRYSAGEMDFPRTKGYHSMHAEVNALRRLGKPTFRRTLVIAGVKPKTGNLLLSRPCQRCWAYARSKWVDLILYHDKEGQVYAECLLQ